MKNTSHVVRSLALAALIGLAWAEPARAQSNADSFRAAITRYTRAHESQILREFMDLLAIPNIANDSINIRRNAAVIVRMLEKRGAAARLLESPTGGPPAVYGEIRVPGATRTVVFYAHYDGQPVGDLTRWATPPWEPVLRDAALEAGGRVIPLPTPGGTISGESFIYGRSAGDDKAPIVAMLVALDALRAAGIQPSVNLKFYFDGEEEAGNAHTRALLERHADLLKSDGWIFADGPVHQNRKQQVVFGVRGVTGVVLTTYGPMRALHSGHYGNWAPNPAVVMANFISSIRDVNGRILIKDFYKDVRALTASERRSLATIPVVDSALRYEFGLGRTEANNALLAERIMQPALNVRSMHAGPVGAAANAIATEATASIDFRLVPSQTPARVRALVEAHAKSLGFTVVHALPDSAMRRRSARIMRFDWGDDGYPGQRTLSDLPFSRAVVRAVSDGAGAPVIEVPTLGGSLPTYIFAEVLKAPLVVVPIANHDDNQHAPNENLRVQNMWDGIAVFAALQARLGAAWSLRP